MKNGMKTIFAALSIMALTLTACNKNSNRSEGHIRINATSSFDITDISTKSNLNEFCTVPAVGDMTLQLIDQDNFVAFDDLFKNFDPNVSLLTGNYDAFLTYGSEDEEGVDKPRMHAHAEFSVESEKLTTVNMEAKLANSIIKIVCTEAFKQYYSNASFTVTTGSANKFVISDGQSAFLEPYRFQITGKMKKQQNIDATFTYICDMSLKPACCYTITIDTSNTGSNTVSITFDNSVQTVDLGEVDIN